MDAQLTIITLIISGCFDVTMPQGWFIVSPTQLWMASIFVYLAKVEQQQVDIRSDSNNIQTHREMVWTHMKMKTTQAFPQLDKKHK